MSAGAIALVAVLAFVCGAVCMFYALKFAALLEESEREPWG